jgi:DNA mismatch endonuclease, patch repair protein
VPEMVVRKLVHRLGFRYRLHHPLLPGKPDITLTRHRKVINVHGCFFHMHDCRYGRVAPKTRGEFWKEKREKTVERDRRNDEELQHLGWQVLTIWECETRDQVSLSKKIQWFMASPLS